MTKTERMVLGWLLFFLILGTGVRFYRARTKPIPLKITEHHELNAAKNALESQRLELQSVNLNQATRQDLESLPGIGPELAKRILSYRDSIGRFSNPEEILNVKGFGPKRFANLKKYLFVTKPDKR